MMAQLLFVGLSWRKHWVNKKFPPPKSATEFPTAMALPLYFFAPSNVAISKV
jgi:hypothetical protein